MNETLSGGQSIAQPNEGCLPVEYRPLFRVTFRRLALEGCRRRSRSVKVLQEVASTDPETVLIGHQVLQKVDVADCQAQGVHLRQALLIWQDGDVRSENCKIVNDWSIQSQRQTSSVSSALLW